MSSVLARKVNKKPAGVMRWIEQMLAGMAYLG